ncbi:hypothetical protein D9615_006880 [Tricholomella constricta]|uniref:Uncharacterized protein n=1 Tax=Tricholomella constricta TaxID=117010 RepID=A0A8H5M2X5_9AGAR|nr:hypothetical protein D9615_006880 [Tricholomella constricta]
MPALSNSFHAFTFVIFVCLSLVMQETFALILLQGRQTCVDTSAPSFNLVARFKNDPSFSVPVKVITVNTVPKVGYSILSTCPSCTTTWTYNTLENGGFIPKSPSNPYLQTVSYSLMEGESPSFISIQFPPPPLAVYCFMDNLADLSGPAHAVLAGNGDADRWALCPNNTASGRVDVVWAPKMDHPHYALDDCEDVYLERV